MSLLSFGRRAEAYEHLQDAARLEPRNPDIQFDLGTYYAQQGDWTNAASCFSNSIVMEPDFATAQRNYGDALASLGRFAEAVPHYREALRLQPNISGAKADLDGILSKHPELR
jgi:tetratricopeptide (TPR) repeat protein